MDELDALITKIAWYYYINNYTQQDIADKMKLSRIKVTRCLQKARERGIVKFSVSLKHGCFLEKEERIKKGLHIEEVTIAPSAGQGKDAMEAVGIAGAMRMNSLLTADDILGVTWGKTLYSVAQNLEPVRQKDGRQIRVVQLMGGLAVSDRINPEEIVKMIASRLNAQGIWMNLPAIVGSRQARDILIRDESVATVFRKARSCNICMLGLGDISENTSLYLAGAYGREDLDALKRAGAVGDILAHTFGKNGVPVRIPLTDRIIAVSLEDIKRIGKRIAFAAGPHKAAAVIGAARGGYINELVIDETTADAIIQGMEKQE